MLGARPRWPAERIVVLQAAVDVVERRRVVDVDVVVLRNRQVSEERPGRRAIVRTIETAVVADHQVIGVLRVDPDDVVVDVHEALAQRVHRLAAVVGDLEDDVGDVDTIDVLRIGVDVAVVHRAGVVVGALLPGHAVVGRAEDAAFAVGRLDVRIEDVGVDRGDGDADPAELLARQPSRHLLPGLAAVSAAVDRALRTAVDHREEMPAPLVGRGDDDVRVARIEHDVADAGVFRDLQHLFPRLAAVGRLVQTAVAAGRP